MVSPPYAPPPPLGRQAVGPVPDARGGVVMPPASSPSVMPSGVGLHPGPTIPSAPPPVRCPQHPGTPGEGSRHGLPQLACSVKRDRVCHARVDVAPHPTEAPRRSRGLTRRQVDVHPLPHQSSAPMNRPHGPRRRVPASPLLLLVGEIGPARPCRAPRRRARAPGPRPCVCPKPSGRPRARSGCAPPGGCGKSARRPTTRPSRGRMAEDLQRRPRARVVVLLLLLSSRCSAPGDLFDLLRAPVAGLADAPGLCWSGGARAVGEAEPLPGEDDLTRQHDGEAVGQRIVVSGRVLDDDGRPVPDTLVEIWQANAAGRYRHARDDWPRAAGPELLRWRPGAHRRAGQLRVHDDQAGRLPVGQPPQRLASRAHPPVAVRARLPAASGDPDVLPGRPAVLPGPDLQLGPDPMARGTGWCPASTWTPRLRSGRCPSGSTWCCAAASRPRSRSPMSEAPAERRIDAE